MDRGHHVLAAHGLRKVKLSMKQVSNLAGFLSWSLSGNTPSNLVGFSSWHLPGKTRLRNDLFRGRLNFGYGYCCGVETVSKMTFGGVSVLANVVSAKLPLQSKVQPGFVGWWPYCLGRHWSGSGFVIWKPAVSSFTRQWQYNEHVTAHLSLLSKPTTS